jgi:hypothetical protein
VRRQSITHQGNMRKEAMRESDCRVEDEIEVLVNRYICIPDLDPKIMGGCAIDDNSGGFTKHPDTFGGSKIERKHLLHQASIPEV